MTSTSSTTERAQQAASAAQDEGTALAQNAAGAASDVAHLAADKTSETAGEAVAQAKDLLRTAKDDVNGQVDAQRQRLVDVLRTTGDELGSAGGGQSALTEELVRRASEQARRLADYLDEHGPDDVLADVRRFARRRPGTFLLLAGVAGVVAGRVFRSVSAASDEPKNRSAASVTDGRYGTSAPAQALGTTSPTPGFETTSAFEPTPAFETASPTPAFEPPPLVPPAPGLETEPVDYEGRSLGSTSPYPPAPPSPATTSWETGGGYPVEDVAVGTAPVPAPEDLPADPPLPPLPGTYTEPRGDGR